MRLTDRVDVLTATGGSWATPTVVAADVPAYVSYTAVAALTAPGRTGLIEELRAVIMPRTFDAETHRLRWRGKVYSAEGPPMVRRRNGADHHLTIPLRYVSG